ncbi:MAG: hypothetical protein KGL39_14875 [Patescibacteria group bacterium]|nr:hypothetical protein [Patescibacteria group bacterium]
MKNEKRICRVSYEEGYIEAGFYFGPQKKGHEENNIFLRLKNFEKKELGFDITIDEAAAIIHVLAACILDKTVGIREKLKPPRRKRK